MRFLFSRNLSKITGAVRSTQSSKKKSDLSCTNLPDSRTSPFNRTVKNIFTYCEVAVNHCTLLVSHTTSPSHRFSFFSRQLLAGTVCQIIDSQRRVTLCVRSVRDDELTPSAAPFLPVVEQQDATIFSTYPQIPKEFCPSEIHQSLGRDQSLLISDEKKQFH